MSIDLRPEDPAFLADPFPLFAKMRDEDPCHWSPRLKSWVLTRYEDVRAVCTGQQMSPDRLDLEGDGMPHLAFGFGLHICLGFPLARLEGEVSLPAVLARFPRIEPTAEPRWLDSLVFRGMSEFLVRVTH